MHGERCARPGRVASGEPICDTVPAGARAIWIDVFYHLDEDDHSVDLFVYWADAIEDADTDERRLFCESAIVRIAEEFLRANP